MSTSRCLILTLATALLVAGPVHAADEHEGHHAAASTAQGHGDDGGEGMRHKCPHHDMKMGGRMPHMIAIPELPPGNAKLQLQMQAEIMTKVGEVLAKYAEQVKDPAPAH